MRLLVAFLFSIALVATLIAAAPHEDSWEESSSYTIMQSFKSTLSDKCGDPGTAQRCSPAPPGSPMSKMPMPDGYARWKQDTYGTRVSNAYLTALNLDASTPIYCTQGTPEPHYFTCMVTTTDPSAASRAQALTAADLAGLEVNEVRQPQLSNAGPFTEHTPIVINSYRLVAHTNAKGNTQTVQDNMKSVGSTVKYVQDNLVDTELNPADGEFQWGLVGGAGVKGIGYDIAAPDKCQEITNPGNKLCEDGASSFLTRDLQWFNSIDPFLIHTTFPASLGANCALGNPGMWEGTWPCGDMFGSSGSDSMNMACPGPAMNCAQMTPDYNGSWLSRYVLASEAPFVGDVYGAWASRVAAPGPMVTVPEMMKGVGGADFSFRTPAAGYIRNSVANSQGPPVVIMFNHELASAEDKAAYTEAFQSMADQQHKANAGARSILTSHNYPGRLGENPAHNNVMYELWTFDDMSSFSAFAAQFYSSKLGSNAVGDIWAGGAKGSEDAVTRKETVGAVMDDFGTFNYYNHEGGFLDFSRPGFWPPEDGSTLQRPTPGSF